MGKREREARDRQERIEERRGRRLDRQQQALFRLIARRPTRAVRVITDLAENGASPVHYPDPPFYCCCYNPLSNVIRSFSMWRCLHSIDYHVEIPFCSINSRIFDAFIVIVFVYRMLLACTHPCTCYT